MEDQNQQRDPADQEQADLPASGKQRDSGAQTATMVAFNEKEIEKAMEKIDFQRPNIAPEKPSWVSRLMTAMATVVFGSPASYGMKPSFFNLPFERADDQTPARPGDFNIERVRENLYINDFRRRMLDGFALPVAALIFVLAVAVPFSVAKFDTWNSNRIQANEQAKREKVQQLVREFGPASVASCEKVLDDYNDFLAEQIAVRKVNEAIDVENASRASSQHKPHKEMPKLGDLSAKRQARVLHGDNCRGLYEETGNDKAPVRMRPNTSNN